MIMQIVGEKLCVKLQFSGENDYPLILISCHKIVIIPESEKQQNFLYSRELVVLLPFFTKLRKLALRKTNRWF